MGLPVTSLIDSAAPPRASPSSLVRMNPSSASRRSNSAAVRTASWPIIASTTNRMSSGWTAALMRLSSFISCSSMASRPAVSTSTTSHFWARAASTPFTARSGGRVSGWKKTGTPSRSPRTWSWWTAAGR